MTRSMQEMREETTWAPYNSLAALRLQSQGWEAINVIHDHMRGVVAIYRRLVP